MAKGTKVVKVPRKKPEGGGARNVGKFLRDVRNELSRVAWPSRNQIVASTIIVIVTVAFFAIFVGILDLIFVQIIKYVSL
jgi:preprotein translocase subunit SecE